MRSSAVVSPLDVARGVDRRRMAAVDSRPEPKARTDLLKSDPSSSSSLVLEEGVISVRRMRSRGTPSSDCVGRSIGSELLYTSKSSSSSHMVRVKNGIEEIPASTEKATQSPRQQCSVLSWLLYLPQFVAIDARGLVKDRPQPNGARLGRNNNLEASIFGRIFQTDGASVCLTIRSVTICRYGRETC